MSEPDRFAARSPWAPPECHCLHIRRWMEDITEKLEIIMSEQSQVDAGVQAIEGDVAAILAAETAIAAEIASLKAANPALDLTGLDKAVADLAGAASAVQGLAPAAPAPVPTPAPVPAPVTPPAV